MSTIDRVRVVWSFPNGGPGVSTFYVTGTSAAADLLAFFNAIKSRIPAAVTLSCDAVHEQLNVESGELLSAAVVGTPWTLAGTGTGPWAAGVGASVKWITGGVVYGHRVNGRTFLAPLNQFSFDTTGTLEDTVRTEIQTAAAALRASATSVFHVYTRPKPAPGGVGPATPGVITPVTGESVADKVATLRSRRT